MQHTSLADLGPHNLVRAAGYKPEATGRSVSFGIALTGLWAALVTGYVTVDVGWDALRYLLPHEMASIVIGAVSPVMLLWLTIVVVMQHRALGDLAAAVRDAGVASTVITEEVRSLRRSHEHDKSNGIAKTTTAKRKTAKRKTAKRPSDKPGSGGGSSAVSWMQAAQPPMNTGC